MIDRYECRECGLLFEAKRPQRQQWVRDPGPDPWTGKWDPERGHNEGDALPHCPRGHRYIRRRGGPPRDP